MEDGIVSPTTPISEINKSESEKSLSKCEKSLSGSSTNLDKIIEAVSKGIMDECHDSNTKLDSNHIEIKPLKSPKVNGIQAKLNDSKSPTKIEKSSPQSKVKSSKKSKKEKEKDKDKDNEKSKDKAKDNEKDKETDKNKDKVKDKDKNKDRDKNKEKEKDMAKDKDKDKNLDKDKDNEKDKEKVNGKGKEIETNKDKDKDKEMGKDKTKVKDKTKEKTKRKEKVKSIADPILSQTDIQGIKEESLKEDENKQVNECVIDKKDCGNSAECMKMDISVDSSNTSEVNLSKDPQPLTAENSINREAFKEHTTFMNGKIEGIVPLTKKLDTDVERKQSRKRRKEKHRSKHGPDSERSSSKEHKKKRKRKSHDHENPESFPSSDGVPKIKIKVHIL